MARIKAVMRFHPVRSTTVLLACLLASQGFAVALAPPSLRCASVNGAGDVTLTWVAPPDPFSEFAEYDLWHASSAAGPFTLITTIPLYGTITYTHLAAGANSAAQFYFITAVNNLFPPDTSIASDTLATIFLTVGQSTPLGDAVLDWTALHVPPTATSGTQYVIQMEYPIGTWTAIDLVGIDTLHLDHEISVCDDSLTFRVAVTDALGCVSYSNRTGDQFADATPPSSPIMVTVSVDTSNGLATLDWDPSPEGDTDAYIILVNGPGGNVIIDTVWGQFNTNYTWGGSSAAFGAESFTIAAFDTCYNGMPPTPNTSATLPPHTTIFCSLTYDKCESEMTIHWTDYGGWPVTSYQIYAQQAGGVVYLLTTEPATSNSFLQTSVAAFTNYCYVVKAIGASPLQRSLSNKACRLTDYPPVPAFNYVRTATVIAREDNLVIDSVDLSAEVRYYHIQRSANGEPFDEVAVIDGGVGPLIQWHDYDVNSDERSYRYRVVVDDSCGNEVLTSNEGGTIFLRAEADLQGLNHLLWNGYEDWAGVVSGYAIYRAIGADPEVLINVNAPTDWTFIDDVSNLFTSNGRFCYRVEAIEGGNPAGIDATSSSNVACAIQQEQVWIPNSFIAGSAYNPEFKPVIAYVDVVDYEFTIINRWGQVIWTTTDPDEAWDGRINGNYVPQGVYAYYCAFENGAGQQFAKRGTVTFLYAVEN